MGSMADLPKPTAVLRRRHKAFRGPTIFCGPAPIVAVCVRQGAAKACAAADAVDSSSAGSRRSLAGRKHQRIELAVGATAIHHDEGAKHRAGNPLPAPEFIQHRGKDRAAVPRARRGPAGFDRGVRAPGRGSTQSGGRLKAARPWAGWRELVGLMRVRRAELERIQR